MFISTFLLLKNLIKTYKSGHGNIKALFTLRWFSHILKKILWVFFSTEVITIFSAQIIFRMNKFQGKDNTIKLWQWYIISTFKVVFVIFMCTIGTLHVRETFNKIGCISFFIVFTRLLQCYTKCFAHIVVIYNITGPCSGPP